MDEIHPLPVKLAHACWAHFVKALHFFSNKWLLKWKGAYIKNATAVTFLVNFYVLMAIL